jgi:hypothetical protein
MKKTLTAMIGIIALTFTGCSGGITTVAPIIGVSGSTGTVTIKETRDRTTGEITRTVENVPAKFTFRATRGSPGGNITGYRVTSAKIGSNADLIDPKRPLKYGALNVFVQSGFSCTPAAAIGQNCPGINKDPANGAESAAIFITDGALEGYMIAAKGPASITYNFVFFGVDDSGHDFEISVPGFNFNGSYSPVL